jgi:hypothetical protein
MGHHPGVHGRGINHLVTPDREHASVDRDEAVFVGQIAGRGYGMATHCLDM